VSIRFYDENAEDFFRRSLETPILDQQRRFADLLSPGARVLDAGCGSGRDARIFREWGYDVTATEAAPKLAELATAHAGVPVQVMTFEEMDWTEAFDGIWACASLLHVPRGELPAILRRLNRALVPGGVWFMSFKYGRGERQAGLRRFTDVDEVDAAAVLAEAGGLQLLSIEVTEDVRADRAGERWLSLFGRRTPSNR
jgi:SAM-dependent methyltransferase